MENNNPTTKILISTREVTNVRYEGKSETAIPIINGSFATNLDGWTYDQWWYWDNGSAVYVPPSTSTINSTLSQPIDLQGASTFTVRVEIVEHWQGQLFIAFGSIANVQLVPQSSGIHEFQFSSYDQGFESMLTFYPKLFGYSQYPTFNGKIGSVTISESVPIKGLQYEWTDWRSIGYVYPVSDAMVALNFQIAPVQDFGTSKGSRSNTITVIADDEAEQVFRHLTDISTTYDGHDARYQHRVTIITNDEIIFEGPSVLKGARMMDFVDGKSKKVYDLFAKDDAANFTTAAQEFHLSNIDLSNHNHILNMDNIQASWQHSQGQIYVYPTLYTESDEYYEVKDFHPSFFFYDLFERAMIKLGYTYEFSDAQLLASMKEWVIPYAGKQPLISDAEIAERSVSVGTQYTYANTNFLSFFEPISGNMTYCDNRVLSYDQLQMDQLGAWDNTLYEFTCQVSGEYEVTLNFPVQLETILTYSNQGSAPYAGMPAMATWDPGGITTWIRLALKKNFQLLEVDERTNPYVFNNSPADGFHQIFDLSLTTTVYLEQGDTLKAYLDHHNRHRFVNGFASNYHGMRANLHPQNANCSFTVAAVKSEVDEGSLIDLNQYTLDLRLSDLVNYIRKKANLYIWTDEFSPWHVHFDTHHDYYNKGEVIDHWEFDDNSEVQIDFLPDIVSQSLLFSDQSDSDDFNKSYSEMNSGYTYGSHAVNLQTDRAKGVKTIGPNKFASTPIVRNKFGHLVPAIDARKLPSKYRVLIWKGVNGSGLPIRYFNGTEHVIADFDTTHCYHIDSISNPQWDLNYAMPVRTLLGGDPINFPESNMFERYWASYVHHISSDDGKMVSGLMYLTPKDISSIKKGLNKKIWINHQWYCINKIEDYQPSARSLTKVELMLLPPLHGMVNTGKRVVDGRDPITIDGTKSAMISNGNSVHKSVEASIVSGSDNFVGSSAKDLLIIGDENAIGAGVESAAIIGASNVSITREDTVFIGDFEITNTGEVVQHHDFVGGILESQIGIDAFTTIEPWFVDGGSETEVRPMPETGDDIQHWFIMGGEEDGDLKRTNTTDFPETIV